jgi:hypothetical protein
MVLFQESLTWDTKAFWEAMFISAGSGSADSHPKAEPREQRGLTLSTLASRLQKQKARFHPYMVTCNCWLLHPQCYVNFFTFRFLKFYFPAMPSPPPPTLSEHKLACFFFLAFLPTTLFPPLTLRPT